ncbi:Putative aminoacrylate peracid reductase RutC [Achromobacter animicus]|uniref:Aminoacrylate peracid reductase RutC n=1 Tax=Achromobacter animicus TaxID=1389935 RepID=A0A6S7AL84_9BURK|nr:RidA family protein [Achromobacter animicus]CAB3733319.1 Putative aminoacrylate peracid reductase RutC [Achromobacter animicus]
MNDIVRKETNERLSRIVIHGDTVYVAGVTSNAEGGIAAQTRDVLAKIDGYLKQAGTDKSRLLTVQIWLKDIERDFAGMNAVWAEWALPKAMPTRATCEAKLASPDLLVEIIVTAAAQPAYVSGPVSES